MVLVCAHWEAAETGWVAFSRGSGCGAHPGAAPQLHSRWVSYLGSDNFFLVKSSQVKSVYLKTTTVEQSDVQSNAIKTTRKKLKK